MPLTDGDKQKSTSTKTHSANRKNTPSWLIFSDLDGTLLDHHTYSVAAALPTLDRLTQHHIPVIFCSSKTFAEIEHLRASIGNQNPFITENGAAVYLPSSQFKTEIKSDLRSELRQELKSEIRELIEQDSTLSISEESAYLVCRFCPPREHWLALLETLKPNYPGLFTHFAQMTVGDIMTATGLSEDEAKRAAQRQFGEPILWTGDLHTKQAFIRDLQSLGGHLLEGGRFLHLSGNIDKGMALRWLTQVYQSFTATAIKTLALGDSDNDIAMLKAADCAAIIRNPVKPAPHIPNAYLSDACGPQGWSQAINHFIDFL